MWIEVLPFLLAASLGFRHAFEADHLVAVGNIVTKRGSMRLAMKDGTFWGLGHTSSILIIGMVMLLLRGVIPGQYFQSMEGAVGVMIIALGLIRLWQIIKESTAPIQSQTNVHINEKSKQVHIHPHKLSFGVGIIHGLAGSGVLIAAAMATMKTLGNSFLFLIIFSIGCIAGMVLAAAALSLPFSRKLKSFLKVQQILVFFSCLLCILLGTRIVVENWFT